MLIESTAAASAMRINLNKSNQDKAVLKFSLTQTSTNGLRTLRLSMPRSQAPLLHLYRIDVVIRKGEASLLHVPLATTVINGELGAELLADPVAMPGLEIWIRTGEHAPLAETMYVIDVGSFK